MKKFCRALIIAAAPFLINMTSEDSSSGDEKKPSVNISCTITTRNGESENIEYLQIHHKIKDVFVYQAPTAEDIVEGTLILKNDPRKKPMTEINIAPQNTSALEIPNPDKVWIFPRNEKDISAAARTTAPDGSKWIEIAVISSNDKKTKNNYVIEMAQDKYQDIQGYQVINGAGSNKKFWAFNAVKKIEITGLSHRDELPKLTKDLKACPPAAPCVCPAQPTPLVPQTGA